MIDVPYQHYEYGGGYNWAKKKNIIFEPSFIETNIISSDSNKFDDYLD